MTATALGSNPAFSLQSIQAAQEQSLLTDTAQLASGKRITTAVDPSGLAIYNTLSAQAQGADTANLNIADASDAVSVAQGAASGIQTALSQIGDLAIEANDGFNSPTDNAALQDEATQLAQGIDQTAGGVNFNGTTVLDGSQSGNIAAGAPSATITTNGAVDAGGAVLTSVSASPATTSGTFVATVDAGGNADVTYTDNATQTTTAVGSFAAGSSATYDGTTLDFGAFSAADAGASATAQTTAATPATTNPDIGLQSGPSEGQTTSVSIPNATTSGLGIANIDLSTPAQATNTEGQIEGAVTSLSLGEAKLGAESASLDAASGNNNILANNLTAAASSIGDDNTAQSVTNLHQSLLQQQISFALLANANVNAGHLNAFLSTYA
jgi:flagellin-like hook-associated protein FlgL